MADGKILRGYKRVTKSCGANQDSNNSDTGIGEPVADTSDGIIDSGESESGITTIDPGSIGTDTDSDSGEPRKRRGRKPGSKNKPRKETPQDLEALLFSMHLMAATMLQTPEFMLEHDESGNLAAAIARVNELYGGIVIPEKVTALINLAMVGSGIYIPRVIAISNRKKAEKRAAKQQLPFAVTPIATNAGEIQ